MPETVVIVGNGVSGITAARHIRKRSDARIIVIGSESEHFYSRTALMYIYMGHMRQQDTKPYEDWFWEKNRIELIRATVSRVDIGTNRVILESGQILGYDQLLLATGSQSAIPPWPGVGLAGVQGLYSLDDLALMTKQTEGIDNAVVVGGGLIGIEMTEMLQSRGIGVTFVVREKSYMDYLLPSEESSLVNDEIRDHNVDLLLGTELARIDSGKDGRIGAVRTNNQHHIECQFAGIAVGVNPTKSLAEASGIDVERGVLVNEHFETSAPRVFAIGDCAQFASDGIGHRNVEQLWYSGRRHGETVAQTMTGNRTAYDRGVFFNSAKFFNLEYQTYGTVPATDTGRITSQFWRHPSERKLIRIAYDSADRNVVGFNVMGIRFRQEQCERWIQRKVNVEDVVDELRMANFDPEFSRRFEKELVSTSRD